jgi:hypothetical protein
MKVSVNVLRSNKNAGIVFMSETTSATALHAHVTANVKSFTGETNMESENVFGSLAVFLFALIAGLACALVATAL